MRAIRVLAVVLSSVVAASCGKDEAKPTPTAPPAVAPPPPAPSGVAIFVDDQAVAQISPQQLASWPRVDTLVPVAARRLGTWQDVFMKGKADKPAELHKPSDQYPDLVPALFVGDDGAPAFGMFDPVELGKHGKPQVRQDDLRELRIVLAKDSGRGEHEQGGGGGGDPSKITVRVKTATGEAILSGAQLLAIPRVPQPGDTGEGRGWELVTLLDAAGVKKFERLVLADAAGLNLTLDKDAFDRKVSIPYVKLNRQGALRVQVFKKQGEGWTRGGDLRGLVSIEVVK
jgi:hypothetical protein